MSNKLYIIGNGFDLHHGLDTRYHGFAKYIRANDSELYYALESYFNYGYGEKDLWSNFEENLANLNIDEILDDNINYLPDISSEDFRGRDLHAFPDVMENFLDKLTSGLVACFTEFIKTVDIPNSSKERMLELDKDSIFFTFNYTYTLEDLYQIDPKKILHIHNGAESKYENIILGHGIDPSNFEEPIPTPPEDLSPEELERWNDEQNGNWDYSYDTGKESIMRYFAASYKATDAIIRENASFFESLSNIDHVLIFGHSLSDVDLPYVKKIILSVRPYTKWTVSYFDEVEKESHLNKLIELGIDARNIDLIEFYEIQIDTKQLRIEFEEENNTSS